jgi:predicted nucleic acid-binding Zn ribbon protein
MFDSDEERQRAELIIMMLAKLYVVLELSPDHCPVCRKALTHDSECPISLAWSLLDAEQQNTARTTIRTLALSIGCDDSFTDPLTH